MTIVTVGIDLAKNVFAVHGVDATGKPVLVRPSVARARLAELMVSLPPCLIGMEACSGAHHWARLFVPTVMPPKPHDWRKNVALRSENLTGSGERPMCSTLRWLCIADFQGAKNAGLSGWRQLGGVRFCVQPNHHQEWQAATQDSHMSDSLSFFQASQGQNLNDS